MPFTTAALSARKWSRANATHSATTIDPSRASFNDSVMLALSSEFSIKREMKQLVPVGAAIFFIFVFLKDVSITKAEDSRIDASQLSAVQSAISAPDSGSIALSGAAEKRASGFFPMRGRREDGDDVTSEDKRAHAFMPMRGRREEDKRRTAFLPMRGRKGSTSYQDVARDLVAKRLRSFMPMRGKKLADEFIVDEDDLDEQKRARSFMPMRGKKQNGGFDYDESAEAKRASYFMPMRGRKDDGDKRARGSGFMPMRGRKADDGAWPVDGMELMDEDEKRAFHAMRGKKTWYPATQNDNVDGFVNALRHAYDGSDPAAYLEDDVDDLQQMATADKRATNTFFGMRGKRNVNHQLATPHEAIDKKKDESFFASRGKRSSNERTTKSPSP